MKYPTGIICNFIQSWQSPSLSSAKIRASLWKVLCFQPSAWKQLGQQTTKLNSIRIIKMTSGPFTWPWKEKEKQKKTAGKSLAVMEDHFRNPRFPRLVKCGKSSGRSFRCPHVGTNRPANRAPHSGWGHRDYSSLHVTKSLLFRFFIFFYFNISKRFNSVTWLSRHQSTGEKSWCVDLIFLSADYYVHLIKHMMLLTWSLSSSETSRKPIIIRFRWSVKRVCRLTSDH